MSEKNAWNIFKKIQEARVLLQKRNLKKSGVNKYAGFSYFELSDFLPHVNEIFNDLGLYSEFRIDPAQFTDDGMEKMPEMAYLTIINVDKPEEQRIFPTRAADAQMKGASAIQQEGSKDTYCRRYCWIKAMEITEADCVDAIDQKTQVEQKPQAEKKKAQKQGQVTAEQLAEMSALFVGNEHRLDAMKMVYRVNTLEELTQRQAESIIKRMRAEANK